MTVPYTHDNLGESRPEGQSTPKDPDRYVNTAPVHDDFYSQQTPSGMTSPNA